MSTRRRALSEAASGMKPTGLPLLSPHPNAASASASAPAATRPPFILSPFAATLGRLRPRDALLPVEPVPDVEREARGHVDRRVRAEDDAGEHAQREVVDDLPAEQEQRERREEHGERGDDRP